MRATLVVSLVIALLAVIFALQNPDPISVRLGPFQPEGSTALILLLTFLTGVIVGALFMVPRRIKKRRLDKAAATPAGEPTFDEAHHVPPTPRG